MRSHRIRLRRPWRCEPSTDGILWRRRFNRPTGLEPGQRVWVVVDGIAAEGSASLNGHELGRLMPDGRSCRFEVTGQLRLHNELVLELATFPPVNDSPTDAPPVEVALEITELA